MVYCAALLRCRSKGLLWQYIKYTQWFLNCTEVCVRNFRMKFDSLCCISWSDFISPLWPSCRCCSNAFHHLHWLHQNVCAVLFVPAQNPHLLPPQLHHDHALCWINEVNGKDSCTGFAKICGFPNKSCIFMALCLFIIDEKVFGVFTFFPPRTIPG